MFRVEIRTTGAGKMYGIGLHVCLSKHSGCGMNGHVPFDLQVTFLIILDCLTSAKCRRERLALTGQRP